MKKKITKKLDYIIHKSDLFGEPVNLNIGRKSMYKTKVGGSTTILLIILFALIFY